MNKEKNSVKLALFIEIIMFEIIICNLSTCKINSLLLFISIFILFNIIILLSFYLKLASRKKVLYFDEGVFLSRKVILKKNMKNRELYQLLEFPDDNKQKK